MDRHPIIKDWTDHPLCHHIDKKRNSFYFVQLRRFFFVSIYLSLKLASSRIYEIVYLRCHLKKFAILLKQYKFEIQKTCVI